MTFQQHNYSMLSKYQVTLEYSVYIISRLHVFLNKKATRGFNWCVSQICMKFPDFIKNQGLSEVTSLSAAFIKSLAKQENNVFRKKKKGRGAAFLSVRQFLNSLCISSSSWHKKKSLIMLFPVLGLASVHFIQIKQQLAEVTCTVLYLNKCFLIWLLVWCWTFWWSSPTSAWCLDEFPVFTVMCIPQRFTPVIP